MQLYPNFNTNYFNGDIVYKNDELEEELNMYIMYNTHRIRGRTI